MKGWFHKRTIGKQDLPADKVAGLTNPGGIDGSGRLGLFVNFRACNDLLVEGGDMHAEAPAYTSEHMRPGR
jgi:hypothetical protein